MQNLLHSTYRSQTTGSTGNRARRLNPPCTSIRLCDHELPINHDRQVPPPAPPFPANFSQATYRTDRSNIFISSHLCIPHSSIPFVDLDDLSDPHKIQAKTQANNCLCLFVGFFVSKQNARNNVNMWRRCTWRLKPPWIDQGWLLVAVALADRGVHPPPTTSRPSLPPHAAAPPTASKPITHRSSRDSCHFPFLHVRKRVARLRMRPLPRRPSDRPFHPSSPLPATPPWHRERAFKVEEQPLDTQPPPHSVFLRKLPKPNPQPSLSLENSLGLL